MLFWLSELTQYCSALNIFRYITFRSIAALFTSFFIVFLLAPRFIQWIHTKGSQPIRLDGPETHVLTKKGKPTMGGVLILFSFVASFLLWADLSNAYVWIASFVLLGFGALGAFDDIKKITKNTHHGLSPSKKMLGQMTIAGLAIGTLMMIEPSALSGNLFFPFLKNSVFYLGPAFFIVGLLVIVGASNAVNLTDGLDGLAIGPIMIASLVLGIMAYAGGHYGFAHYLHIPFVPKAGELAVLCSILVGSGLGFLWYNAPPAMIMLGDVGALSLGGFLGTVSVMIKQEIILAVVGGIFVIETLSVVIQVLVFKKTGRRFFLMAPIHHHFEKKGWSESTVVMRFWIVSVLLGLVALSSLKLR